MSEAPLYTAAVVVLVLILSGSGVRIGKLFSSLSCLDLRSNTGFMSFGTHFNDRTRLVVGIIVT